MKDAQWQKLRWNCERVSLGTGWGIRLHIIKMKIVIYFIGLYEVNSRVFDADIFSDTNRVSSNSIPTPSTWS